MEAVSKKTQAFMDAITARTEKETSDIEAAVRAETDAVLSAFREATEQDAERRRVRGEAAERAKCEKALAGERLEARRKLLRYREECGEAVYAEVLERLRAASNAPEYEKTLLSLLKRALALIPGGEGYTLLLRSEDMKYADALRAAAGTATDVIEGGFTLGGLILECREKKQRADMTFDSAYADLAGRFAELTGFRVEEA